MEVKGVVKGVKGIANVKENVQVKKNDDLRWAIRTLK